MCEICLIAPSYCTKNEIQIILGIYIGYDSPSIFKYHEIETGDVFTDSFVDCHFDEAMILTLRGENKHLEKEIN